MPRLCPTTYIPSNISHSKNELQLSLQNTSQELLNVYKQKVPCDMVIRLNLINCHHSQSNRNSNSSDDRSMRLSTEVQEWSVHVYVVEQHSDIFWKGLAKKEGDVFVYEIVCDRKDSAGDFEELFEKVVNCMYGVPIIVQRFEVKAAYSICQQLHLTQLLDLFHNDMLINFEEYEIFPLLQMANEEKIIDVITMCYECLEIEHFQQLRYNRPGLLVCEPDLFRAILRRHNVLKFQRGAENFGLWCWEVKGLVEEYCAANGIQGRRKERFLQQIENKGIVASLMMSQTQISSPMSPKVKRMYSCTKILSVTSLSDIKQPEEFDCKSNSNNKRKSKALKCVSFADDESFKNGIAEEDEFGLLQQPRYNSQTKDMSDDEEQNEQDGRSISNCSISSSKRKRMSDNNPSIAHNQGSKKANPHLPNLHTSSNLHTCFPQICDPQTVHTLTSLTSSLQSSLKSSTDIQKKATVLIQSLKHNLKRSKERTCRIKTMESELEEIWAEVMTGHERLGEVERVVGEIERKDMVRRREVVERRKRKEVFETSIALELTVSTEFGQRLMRRPS